MYPFVTPHHLSHALSWLQRSSSAPISIFLDLRNPSWDWNESTPNFRWQEMKPIMDLFASCLSLTTIRTHYGHLGANIYLSLHTRHIKSVPLSETISLSRCNLYFAVSDQAFQPISLCQPSQFFGGVALERTRRGTY